MQGDEQHKFIDDLELNYLHITNLFSRKTIFKNDKIDKEKFYFSTLKT